MLSFTRGHRLRSWYLLSSLEAVTANLAPSLQAYRSTEDHGANPRVSKLRLFQVPVTLNNGDTVSVKRGLQATVERSFLARARTLV